MRHSLLQLSLLLMLAVYCSHATIDVVARSLMTQERYLLWLLQMLAVYCSR